MENSNHWDDQDRLRNDSQDRNIEHHINRLRIQAPRTAVLSNLKDQFPEIFPLLFSFW